MGRNRLATIFAALLVALLALPAFAQASGQDVIRDCWDDGSIDGSYSQDEYQEAQDNLPSDIDQYGDCADVIAQAQADRSRGAKGSKRKGSAGGGSGGSGTGGSAGSSGSSATGAGGAVSDGQSRRGGSPKPLAGDAALETSSGAYAPSQDDKAAYDRARAEAARGGSLPGGLAIPAAGEFKAASAALPLPVVLALIAIGLLVTTTTLVVARKRVPAIDRVASRFRRS